jgi:hypothetical protein
LAIVLGLAMGLGVTRGVLAQPTSEAVASELAEAGRLNGEAVALHNAGKSEAAVPVALRALAIHEKALGPDHPDVAISLNNLAALYQSRGTMVAPSRCICTPSPYVRKPSGPTIPMWPTPSTTFPHCTGRRDAIRKPSLR